MLSLSCFPINPLWSAGCFSQITSSPSYVDLPARPQSNRSPQTIMPSAAKLGFPHLLSKYACRSIGQLGLLAAVSRIAAILPNDLAPTNMNGPNRTLAVAYSAAVQLSHCGHSCMAQHFCRLKRRCAGRTRPWSISHLRVKFMLTASSLGANHEKSFP